MIGADLIKYFSTSKKSTTTNSGGNTTPTSGFTLNNIDEFVITVSNTQIFDLVLPVFDKNLTLLFINGLLQPKNSYSIVLNGTKLVLDEYITDANHPDIITLVSFKNGA
jgi:hypothetical protein